jgi:hypothetical protein
MLLKASWKQELGARIQELGGSVFPALGLKTNLNVFKPLIDQLIGGAERMNRDNGRLLDPRF